MRQIFQQIQRQESNLDSNIQDHHNVHKQILHNNNSRKQKIRQPQTEGQKIIKLDDTSTTKIGSFRKYFRNKKDNNKDSTTSFSLTSIGEQRQQETNDFRNRLIVEVFNEHQQNVNAFSFEKIIVLFWLSRYDPNFISHLVNLVIKRVTSTDNGTDDVLNEVTLYLPQLVHMIIHFGISTSSTSKQEVSSSDGEAIADHSTGSLERLILLLSQQSLQIALQYHWILQTHLIDSLRELPNGNINPYYNPLVYHRIKTLLANLDRYILLGEEEYYQLLLSTQQHLSSLQQHSIFGGLLLYKQTHSETTPTHEAESVKSKQDEGKEEEEIMEISSWTFLYFNIHDNILQCYENEDDAINYPWHRLIRCIPLNGATVTPVVEILDNEEETPAATTIHENKQHSLVITNFDIDFHIMASTKEETMHWMQILKNESNSNSLHRSTYDAYFYHCKHHQQQQQQQQQHHHHHQHQHQYHSQQIKEAEQQQVIKAYQLERHNCFHNTKKFLRVLTDINDSMRDVDRTQRKDKAQRELQKYRATIANKSSSLSSFSDNNVGKNDDIYLPTGDHNSIYNNKVCDILSEDIKIFNTYRRCLTMLYLVSEKVEGIDCLLQQELRQQQNVLSISKKYLHPFSPAVLQNNNQQEKQQKIIYIEGHKDAEEENKKSIVNNATVASPCTCTTASPSTTASSSSYTSEDCNSSVSSSTDNEIFKVEYERSSYDMYYGFTTNPFIEDWQHKSDQMLKKAMMTTRKNLFNNAKSNVDKDKNDNENTTYNHGYNYPADAHNETKVEISPLLIKTYRFNDFNADLRQEALVMQLMYHYKSMFEKANIPIWLKPSKILHTTKLAGVMEVYNDVTTISEIKKQLLRMKNKIMGIGDSTNDDSISISALRQGGGLQEYFEITYGPPESVSYKIAQKKFTRSLAGYSLLCYLLGINDRHNDNIFIDNEGHIIHIDFSFIFGKQNGGKYRGVERSPFKLTKEYVDIMGGLQSSSYRGFQRLFVKGFMEARRNWRESMTLIEIISSNHNSFPCFNTRYTQKSRDVCSWFESRFLLQIPDHLVEQKVIKLIEKSYRHPGTYLYDLHQTFEGGYAI